MSFAVIRKLLEVQLSAVPLPALLTAWDGLQFTPIAGSPWQKVSHLHNRTLNPTMGDDFKRERGIFQITSVYPSGTGSSEAIARADALISYFKRGTVLEEGNVKVRIINSPSIGGVVDDGGWFRVSVSVPYVADVFPV